jgi:hypothetical protein
MASSGHWIFSWIQSRCAWQSLFLIRIQSQCARHALFLIMNPISMCAAESGSDRNVRGMRRFFRIQSQCVPACAVFNPDPIAIRAACAVFNPNPIAICVASAVFNPDPIAICAACAAFNPDPGFSLNPDPTPGLCLWPKKEDKFAINFSNYVFFRSKDARKTNLSVPIE